MRAGSSESAFTQVARVSREKKGQKLQPKNSGGKIHSVHHLTTQGIANLLPVPEGTTYNS
jgi:hypothetical protein